MKAMAAFFIRGRTQAVVSASVLAILALLITPLSILSSAVIGLVVLRKGAAEGLLTGAAALVAMAALGQLLFGAPLALALMGISLWLPVWGLALVLRSSVSLARTLEVAVVAAILLVAAQYLAGDPATYWTDFLQELTAPLAASQVMTEADRQATIAAMVPWMPGALGAAWLLQLVMSLFLARSWQAALYNPGGFAREIRALRLGRGMLLAMPLLLVLSALGPQANLFAQWSLVAAMAFVVQGVGLVHGLLAGRPRALPMLLVFYLLLVVTLPTSLAGLAGLGYADGWFDFRARTRVRSDRGGDKD